MKTEVQQVVGLGTGSTEDTLLQGWLNDAVVDVLRRTGCYVASATATETADTGDYTLDTGILTVKAFSWAGSTDTTIPERVPIGEILRLRASYLDAASASPATKYAVAGSNMLMVWPTPADADTITVYYVPRPTAMSSGSHDPSNTTYGGIPSEFHPALVTYGKWKAADYRDDESSSQGERYRIEYEGQDKKGGMLADIRNSVRGHGGSFGRSIFAPRRRRRSGRNDVYPGW